MPGTFGILQKGRYFAQETILGRARPLSREVRAVAAAISGWTAEGRSGIVAYSELMRAYGPIIIGDNPAVRLGFLKRSRELILRRMAARHGHFMPLRLLDDHFAILEEPTPEELPIVVSIDGRPGKIVTEIAAALTES